MTHRSRTAARVGWLLAALGLGLAGSAVISAAAAPTPVKLVFLYGSEKQKWLEEVTADYENTNPTINDHPVQVELTPMGSGDIIDDVLTGRRRATLISPASQAYVVFGNAQAVQKGQAPLVGATTSLVKSPVVIAMWKPMAEALGWPKDPVGWKTLRILAANKDGWKSVGHPQWGAFKFGHTHPEESNSGLIALLSQVYAAVGKTKDLTVSDVERPATTQFLTELERSVVHYGSSTGFFANQMFAKGGDSFVSAAVLYENLVIDSYDPTIKGNLQYDLVAIYPEEGTFMSDHPVGVVQRDWVTDDQKKAADDYIAFLMKKDQQAKALKRGFRPALGAVPAGTKNFDADHGVDPSKPGFANVLQPPDADVMEACIKAWRATKKKAHVVLVVDASKGMTVKSMNYSIQDGAKAAIDALADGDELSVLTFNDKITWLAKNVELTRDVDLKGKTPRDHLKEDTIDNGIGYEGPRGLYNAIDQAHDFLNKNAKPDTISAVIVLTKAPSDDDPNKLDDLPETAANKLTLEQLKARIMGRNIPNQPPVYIFAFAFGSDKSAAAEQLKAIVGCARGDVKFGQVGNAAEAEKVRVVIKGFAFLF